MERQITLSLSELEIQGNSIGTIHIKWFPKEAGCWRDVVQLTDNKRIKYDIVIATIAKSDKKTSKTRRKPLLPKSNFVSTSVTRKQFQQNTTLSKTSTTTIQPLVDNLDKQYKSKYESDLDKENVFNKNSEVKIDILLSRNDEHNKINNENHECNKLNIFDQSMNMSWKDGSILPQTFLPLNVPQDIRRATYIKEKACNNILHKYDERVTENSANVKNTTQSDISVMLNKFTLTSTDALLSSPQVIRKELTESINLQDSDKHKTFNIIDGQFLEIPATQSASLHNLSLNKFEMSFVTDMNDLIASSPIGKQRCNTSKESTEQLKHLAMEMNHSTKKSECEHFSFEAIPENIAGDIYIEISPPKYSHSKSFMSKSCRMGRITKNKTLCDIKSAKKLNVLATSEFRFKPLF